ncbi:hypothetical protein [Brevibacterium album]|uniref:hypothetical protein n=1 Tax=Brevibacterium album TaxID=417948 RepID=UPI00041519FB|nr:hypothetical protein [Brevibacterium album]
MFREVLADLGGRVYATSDDSSLFIWWFAHAADVAASWFGAGSGETTALHTVRMNHPDGVNAAWNTSVLGLALPLAPLTWWLGPVVVYNLCILASPVAAGMACALLLTRFTRPGAAYPAATLYAFSPYLVAQAGGHLNLSFAALPPLVGVFVHAAVTGPRGGGLAHRLQRLLPAGVLLAAAVGWQFYLSTELLAGTFLAASVCLLATAVVLRGRLLARLAPAAVVGAGAAVSALLLAAPLLSTMLAGPGAPREALRPHGVWSNDLADALVPPGFAPFGQEPEAIERVVGIDPAEVGGHLSLVWLLLGVWAAVRMWNSPRYGALVRITALTGVLVWLLSMGSSLRVGGGDTGVPGPFALVEQIPVLDNVLPMRLSVHVVLCLAVLTAVLLQDTADRAGRSRIVAVTGLVLAAASLAPAGVQAREIAIPEFFRDGAWEQSIPAEAVVKAVPQPRALAEADADQAMVWQALTGLHYRETGGYFIGSTPEHPVIYQSLLDPLDQALGRIGEEGLDAVPREELRTAVLDSAARGTDFVLVPADVPRLPAAGDELAEALRAASGAQARLVDDVWVLDLRGLA